MSDRPVTGTSALQHVKITRERRPCSRRDSNHNPSKRVAAHSRLRPRGHRDLSTDKQNQRFIFLLLFCSLLNDAAGVSEHITLYYLTVMCNYIEILCLNGVNPVPNFSMRVWGGPRQTSVRIIGALAEIRTGHFPNTS